MDEDELEFQQEVRRERNARLSKALDWEIGQDILSFVKDERDVARAKNDTRPERSDDDLTKDFVYLAGMIAAYNKILSLPARAREEIQGEY